MESKQVAIVMALIVLVAAGAAYYYWGQSATASPVTGVVLEKVQRDPGTEAGDKPLAQGLRVLSGESMQQEVFYVLRVKTKSGELIEMVVPKEFFAKVQQGDVVQQVSSDAVPSIVRRAAERK